MANEALWTPDSTGSPGDGHAAVAVESSDSFLQDLGYEAADPMLIARLCGEAPTSWPAFESRP
ncbi:hypothetical protein [Ideonella sp. BN130291]|uniref:hypothetical protein n=1 Tax=Ideonella sp. BN130291 TaxID=3112940 RepID=UPI002E272B8F|nr:hypothetical protein [Ideonella sp. BN130291]